MLNQTFRWQDLQGTTRVFQWDLGPVWWPAKSVAGFQWEKPELFFPHDFLDLCLPFEDQERRMVSTAHHPFPWHKVAKLLYCLVSRLFKAWKERAELICLCYWHLYIITWWSCGYHVVISEWPSQSTARKHCAPVQSGRSGWGDWPWRLEK